MTETLVQFSVFLGNKPGMLARICRDLAAAKVNIVALTMVDAAEHGVLRIVAQDPVRTRAALAELNLSTSETQVLAVTMPNRPGALADVCEKLSSAQVHISYLYSTTGVLGGKAIGVFKVHDPTRAAKILGAHRASTRDTKAKLRNNNQRVRTMARR
jgi:hypothetical protein